MSEPTDLANELRALREGAGLQTPQLGVQVGPALRELANAAPNESTAAIRAKLTSRLLILVEGLPDDVRQAVVTALALEPDTQHQLFRERMQSLADRQRQDVRTIRRRVDEGFRRLAEIAARSPIEQPRGALLGWHTDRFEVVLRLDKDAPESFERRRIVADQGGLEMIQQSITLPGGSDTDIAHGLDCETLFGAAVVSRHHKPGNRFTFDLALPRPLGTGERHEYGLILRISGIQSMRTHYVMFPDRQCDEFDLRIHFGPGQLPRLLWRVDEIFRREIGEPQPQTPLAVDKLGEVHVTFRNLLPGHGYGVQWLMEDDDLYQIGENEPPSAEPIVSVYVDTYDEEKVAAIQTALAELLDSEELHIELLSEPEISSWFARFKIKSKEVLTKGEVASRLQKIEHAIEVTGLHRPMSEVNAKHADAASRLVQAANEYDEVVMLVGSVMLVKFTSSDGRKRLVVKTLSVAEVRAIESNAHILKDPQAALAYLDYLADGSQQGGHALAEAAHLSAARIAYRHPPNN